MSKNAPFVSDNVLSALKTRNLRKRKYNRLLQSAAKSSNNQVNFVIKEHFKRFFYLYIVLKKRKVFYFLN